ncbi:unnamed protein product [marine sediment metagenome]|uniref:Uncharacterized protein n=1 Tax=marine sediment metagenome TaxID=412755 RepID=X1KMV8_9ZZZZ
MKNKDLKFKGYYVIAKINNLGEVKILCKITGKTLMKKLIPGFGKRKDLDKTS